jgi:hypothetical protein
MRRFPPPWTIEEHNDACFIVRDATRKPLAELESKRKDENDKLRRAHDEQIARAIAAQSSWKKKVEEAVKHGGETPSKPKDAEHPGEFVTPRLFTSDVTVERLAMLLQARPSGMLLVDDELSGWFETMSRYSGGTDRQFWLKAWDGRPHPPIERMGRPPVNVPSLLVGVTGGMQPDKLSDIFKGAADGMAARFLYSWPEPAPYRHLTDAFSEIDDDIVDILNQLSRLPARGAVLPAAAARSRHPRRWQRQHELLP